MGTTADLNPRVGPPGAPQPPVPFVPNPDLAANLAALSAGQLAVLAAAIATNPEVAGRYAPLGSLAADGAVAPSVILFGDSVVAQNGTGPDTVGGSSASALNTRGFWVWAAAFLGQRMRMVRNAGVGGDTTAQMVARINADVMAYDSSWVVVAGGANDIAGDVASATTIANLTTIVTTIIADGRKVLLLPPWPSDNYSTTPRKTAFTAVYDWVMAAPLTFPNVVVADTWRPLVDPSDGGPATGMAIGGVHPSGAAALRAGKVIADTLAPIVPARPPRLAVFDSVIANPGFLTGGSGWSTGGGSGVSVAYAAHDDGWSNKATITMTGVTDDAGRFITAVEAVAGGRYAGGDVIQATARIRFADMVPRADTFQPFLRLYPRLADNSFGLETLAMFVASAEEVTIAGAPSAGDITVITHRCLLPATTTNLYVAVGWQGVTSGVLTVSDLSVHKV